MEKKKSKTVDVTQKMLCPLSAVFCLDFCYVFARHPCNRIQSITVKRKRRLSGNTKSSSMFQTSYRTPIRNIF